MKSKNGLSEAAEAVLLEMKELLIKYYSEVNNDGEIYHILAYNALCRILILRGIEEAETCLLLAKGAYKDTLKQEIEKAPEGFTKEELELATQELKRLEEEFKFLKLKEDKEAFNC